MPHLALVVGEQAATVRAIAAELGACARVTDSVQGGQLRRRERISDDLRRTFLQQESAKLRFFWPPVRRLLPNGPAIAKRALADQREIEEVLTRFRWYTERSTELNELSSRLVEQVRLRMEWEERLLAELTGLMETSEAVRLGTALARASRFGPLRPHPNLPATAWSVALLRRPLAVVDRLIEAATGSPFTG